MGLFLGASVMTVTEFVELLIIVACNVIKRFKRLKHQHKTTDIQIEEIARTY